MGYDNECLVNIQSLPGEYFCPVCRTLVYPNEALQAQCTHLYCKPCLTYVVATTHACPYDGYLVTEADSKPLVESSEELAKTIGNVAVHCLYHRSGCQWKGTLAESTGHGTECSYGNSPVVCNRCGTQIIHRQVQEHAQICLGIQPQGQAAEKEYMQSQAATVVNQAVSQDPLSTASVAAPTAAPTLTAAPSAPATAVSALGQAHAPTPVQWYQQQQMQYQQYYQQYPGYDPYQQQYQQYAQYQHQGYPQQYMQPQMQDASQPCMQQPQPSRLQAPPMPHSQPQAQVVEPQLQQPHHPLPQPLQPQAQPQPISGQVPQMQAQQPFAPPQQPQTHPYPQPQLPAAQACPPQLQAPPQHQQPVPPQQLPQRSQPRPHHPLPHLQPQLQQSPMQMQPQPQLHPNAQPASQMQPPAHPVYGYQSYSQPTPGTPQQHPMHMPPQQGIPPQHPPQPQSQFPSQQHPQMHPPPSQTLMPVQQQPAMPPPQGPCPNIHPTQQQVQHLAYQPGQQVYQQPCMQQHTQQHGFLQPQAQGQMHPGPPQHPPQQSLRPQGPTYMQRSISEHPHPQINAPPAQGFTPHHPHARPLMVSEGMPEQPVLQSPHQSYMGRAAPQSGPIQQSQPPRSGRQDGLVPASPATPKQGSSSGTINQRRHAERIKSGEKISEHTSDLKSKGEEGQSAIEVKAEDGQTENDNKDVCQNNVDGPLVKPVKAEEGSNISGEVTEGSHGLKAAGREKEIQGQEDKYDDKGEGTYPGSDKFVQRSNIERTSQGYASDGQNAGNVNNMHPPQKMQAPGGLERGRLQQLPTCQNVLAQGHGYQPGYNDKNPSEFSQQYHGIDGHQGMLPGPRPSNQERYPPGPPKQIANRHHPQVPDPLMASQRPPAQPMHQSGRFPEPSAHQMHVHGQGTPSQMMPPGQVPLAHEPFWPPPHASASSTGLPPPPGAVPSHHGFPPKGSGQQQSLQGQSYTHLPPTPPSARPSYGFVDAPSGEMGGHPFMPKDRMGKLAAVNAMEVEALALNRSGVHDGRQLEPHRPPLTEHSSYGQPNVMKMNDMTNNVPGGGMSGSSSIGGLPEDRFRPFTEEGLNPVCDEHLRMLAFNPGRHFSNRRDFNEDLKQFPRSAHLDGEGPPRFGGYSSSLRPLSSYPPDIDSSEVHQDIGDRGYFSQNIMDGVGHFSNGRGNDTSQNYSSFLRGGGIGGFREHDTHGMPSTLRTGDPGFNGRFDLAAREGGIDSFQRSRKRKAGSTVRCLICMIDCETVEGLELHAQRREHKKMAMDMVLSIKKENAKKHKLNSENASPFEGANKSRKASANRQ